MNLICIIIYNRLPNLLHWAHCLKQCTLNAKVAVIHNSDLGTDRTAYLKAAHDMGAYYVPRENIGFDIAAFQDVVTGRLKPFPKWDSILWITDDVRPMAYDFDRLFWEQTDKGNVACMELSPYVKPHIRTTGFAIAREVASKLTFPADPITTKEQCYHWEHRSPNTFYDQLNRLGVKTVMISNQVKSPLWDEGYHRRLKLREQEHYKIFGHADVPTNPKVAFICPVYHNYPIIAHALICQTYQNWELHLVHDGPPDIGLPGGVKDRRVFYTETNERAGNWGHSIRRDMLQRVNADYIVISNPDNYLTPNFIEAMLKGFKKPGTIATYCSGMVHSYKNWEVIRCIPQRGYIDCSGVMLKLDAVKAVGWNDVTSHSADWVFFNDIIKRYGADKWVRVPGTLLIHN